MASRPVKITGASSARVSHGAHCMARIAWRPRGAPLHIDPSRAIPFPRRDAASRIRVWPRLRGQRGGLPGPKANHTDAACRIPTREGYALL